MSGRHVWKETPEKMKRSTVKTWRRGFYTKFICEICDETILAKTKPEPGFSREHWGPAFHPILMGCARVVKLTCICQNQAVHYYEWIQPSSSPDKVKIIGRCDQCSISDQEVVLFAQWHESLRRMTPEEIAVYLVHES